MDLKRLFISFILFHDSIKIVPNTSIINHDKINIQIKITIKFKIINLRCRIFKRFYYFYF